MKIASNTQAGIAVTRRIAGSESVEFTHKDEEYLREFGKHSLTTTAMDFFN